MKHGKTPTRKQKKKIISLGLNPENWLVSRDNTDELVLIHRKTGNVRRKGYKEVQK